MNGVDSLSLSPTHKQREKREERNGKKREYRIQKAGRREKRALSLCLMPAASGFSFPSTDPCFPPAPVTMRLSRP